MTGQLSDLEMADIAKARELWAKIAALIDDAEAELTTMNVHVAVWLMLTSVLHEGGAMPADLVETFEEMRDDDSEPPEIPNIN